jgi:hypothetical protein
MALVLEGAELKASYQNLSIDKQNSKEAFDWKQFIEKLKDTSWFGLLALALYQHNEH